MSNVPPGVELSFCPTGEGGGVDPTCSPSQVKALKALKEAMGKRGSGLAYPLAVLGDLPIRDEAFGDYLTEHGQEWKAQKLPDGVKRGKMGECFKNATQLMLRRTDLTYCEGIAYHHKTPKELGYLHAWCVDDKGNVYDNTWDEPEKNKYFGVTYNRTKYMAHIMRTKMYGVFGGKDKAARKVIEKGGL